MFYLLKKNFNLRVSLTFIFSSLIIFFCARLALLLIYSANFEMLTNWQIFKAFLNGIRFDYSVIAIFLLPCLLVMNLPVKSRVWFKIWAFAGYLVIFLISLLLIADIIYFAEVNRHITQEIIQIKYEMGFMVNYAITQYWYILIVLIGFLCSTLWFFNRQVNKYWQAPKFSFKSLIKIILIFVVLIVLGVRGHLGGGKSLGMASVYKYSKSSSEAALILNGVFSSFQVLRKDHTVEDTNTYPFEQAIKEVQILFKEEASAFKNADFPLLQFPQYTGKVKDINFVIIMLEGWAKYAIGVYNSAEDTHTPYFDEMAKNGVLFTNAYATGQRSILGFASIFAGLPLINSLPMFGYGLEQNNINKLPEQFLKEGYYTFYVQTSNRDSYRMCALANLLGSEESYGAEDIPNYMEYQGRPQFGYDYDALMFMADKIKARKKHNFMAFAFTGTTHDPFVKLSDQFEIYKDGSFKSQYKNSIAYADFALGSLINRAKEDGWFDNTVFIFLSDHIGGRAECKDVHDHFAIPLLIYAPKILKPQVINYPVSQLDIMPTVYKLSALNTPHTVFGNDLLNPSLNHFALISDGVNNGIITGGGAILYDGKKIIEQKSFTADFDSDKTLNMLLALDKAASTLLKNNKWYKEVEIEK